MSSAANIAVSTKSELTRSKLVDAGIELFSRFGYEATSTRQVQEHAGVQRNLITYHFGSKELFWKACMEDLFGRLNEVITPAIEQSMDIEPEERIRFLIRRFVRVSAAHPESTRIMFDEGRSNDWRLEWLVEQFARPFFETLSQLYASSGLNRRSSPSMIQFYYLLVSSASVYAMAPEYHKLSGEDPFDEERIDQHANMIADLLTRSFLSDQEKVQ